MESNKIKTFADLKNAIKTKDELIKKINIDFTKNYHSATLNLTRDLINNSILAKLLVIKSQLEDPIILKAETDKKESLQKLKNDRQELELIIESVLSLLTAKFNQKKRINKIIKASTSIAGDNKYIAYVGGESGYQIIIDDIDDISKAEAYYDANAELMNYDKKLNEILEQFKQDIQNIEYIEMNFDDELSELIRISKFDYLNKLSDLDPEKNYLLYGDDQDYDTYEKSLIKISNICNEIQEKYYLYL